MSKNDVCVTCEKPITGKYYAGDGEDLLCEPCVFGMAQAAPKERNYWDYPYGSSEYVKLHGDVRIAEGKRPTERIEGFDHVESAEEHYRWAERLAYFPLNGAQYLQGIDLDFYTCSECGAKECKLWREYNTFLDHQTFYCGNCVFGDKEKTFINSEGTIKREYGSIDQIEGKVPAVPTEDGSYWGYTSVPGPGVRWWKALPSYPSTRSEAEKKLEQLKDIIKGPTWVMSYDQLAKAHEAAKVILQGTETV